RRISAHRQRQIFAQLAELLDIGDLLLDVISPQPQEHPRGDDVLVPRILAVETGQCVEERRDSSLHHDTALARLVDARECLEQGRFSRAVVADQSETVAFMQLERDAAQRRDDDAMTCARALTDETADRALEHDLAQAAMRAVNRKLDAQ